MENSTINIKKQKKDKKKKEVGLMCHSEPVT